MSYYIKKHNAEKKASKILGVVILAAVFLATIVWLLTPSQLDENFCPVDKASIKPYRLSMLIDISDSLTANNTKIIDAIVSDWVDSGSRAQKLAIYSLNTSTINNFQDTDTICSPPNQKLLQFAYGRQKAKDRIEKFKARVAESIKKSSVANSAISDSLIIESVRQITNGPHWFPGSSRLILISDLIEKSQVADFYNKPVPLFSDWIKNDQNRSLVASIQLSKGDKVQICQLLTDKPGYASRDAAKIFWVDLFKFKGVSEIFFACNGLVKD